MIKLVATFFYAGYFKKAPGTFASLFSFILLWFLYTGTLLNLSIFFVISFLSVLVCGKAEEIFENKDDKRIVLDEFVGSFFSVLFVPKLFWFYVFAFLLFRFFDVVKPFFISNVQDLGGGVGIVLDDVLAGIMTSVVMVIFMFTISQ